MDFGSMNERLAESLVYPISPAPSTSALSNPTILHQHIADESSIISQILFNSTSANHTLTDMGPVPCTWMDQLLNRPYAFFYSALMQVPHFIVNLPPLFTHFIFPMIGIYCLYRIVKFVLDEYQGFLDLGRGGTASTPWGFVKVSVKKFFARVDVLSSPHVDPMLEPYRGKLFGLKKRPGVRPIVKGVAPQRQFDQKAPESTFDRLMEMLKDAAKDDDNLKVTTSYLEGHTDALKAIFADKPHEVLNTDSEWDFEIAHPHRNDGSWHAILHPEDVGVVVQQGWGERHPLATDSLVWRIYYHYLRRKRRPVPYNLVFVYAPRTENDYKVAREILDAAIWYHKERDIREKINQGVLARTGCGGLLGREQALRNGEWIVGPDGKLITRKKAIEHGLVRPRGSV